MSSAPCCLASMRRGCRRSSRSNPPGIYLARTHEALEGSHYELALAISEEFPRRFPEDRRGGQAALARARALRGLDRRLEAQQVLERLLAASDTDGIVSAATHELAVMFGEAGDELGALAQWERLLDVAQGEQLARALFEAAGLYERLGQTEAALRHYDRLAREHPDDQLSIDARLRLAALLRAEGRPGEARLLLESLLEEATEGSPTSQAARAALAELDR